MELADEVVAAVVIAVEEEAGEAATVVTVGLGVTFSTLIFFLTFSSPSKKIKIIITKAKEQVHFKFTFYYTNAS